MGCSSGGCSTGGCSSGGCSSVSVYDWLSDVTMPGDPYNIVEIQFKGGRKGFFRNENNLTLLRGDFLVVDSGSGHDIGEVSLQGELVKLQLRKKKVKDDDKIPKIYRLATERDLERREEAKNREISTMYRAREIIRELKLKMKLSDVEYQADNTKATFYYSADDRVDFRELIKNLASEFRIRVEMRQISLRQEAGRVGGIGSCGRELCCTTWLTDFKSVSTSAARYQNLSLNPLKLSGQCGRLKCCLNYELETYMEELKDIPKVEKPLKTEEGEAFLQKTDIFKKLMWFSFKGDNNWHVVPVKRVTELIALNKSGTIPHSLHLDEEEEIQEVAVNDDLLKLDKKYSKNKPKRKKKPSNNNRAKKEFQKSNTEHKAKSRNNRNKKRQSTKSSSKPNTENIQAQPNKNKEKTSTDNRKPRNLEQKKVDNNKKPQGKRPQNKNTRDPKNKANSSLKSQQSISERTSKPNQNQQESKKPKPERRRVNLKRENIKKNDD